MTLYVDSSAFAKRYLDEPDRMYYIDAMNSDDRLLTARHTLVETGRIIGNTFDGADRETVLQAFNADWLSFAVAELDVETCARALEIAFETGARTLDALHLAAAWRGGGSDLKLLSADQKQCDAALKIGIDLYTV